MAISDMLQLQCTIFMIVLLGVIMKKRGIIDENGKRCITDLCVNLIIPCNILKSFISGLDREILTSSLGLLMTGVVLEIAVLVINMVAFNRFDGEQKKIMKYATLVPNSGFMGNAIAEGLWGSLGVLYASIFMIPLRIVMWSFGTSYFMLGGKTDKKKVIKNILTHPCLVAVYLGIFLMLTGIRLPAFLSNTVKYCGNCTMAITMLIIGTILADTDPKKLVDKVGLLYAVLRLVLIPLLTMVVGMLFKTEGTALGIAVLMNGMPAGSTTALFAARYNSDAEFATRIVVITTLLSMITLPLWCMVLG